MPTTTADIGSLINGDAFMAFPKNVDMMKLQILVVRHETMILIVSGWIRDV